MDKQIVKHPKDKPLKSSPSHIKEFKKSVVWMDMKQWLQDRIDSIQQSMEEAVSVDELRRCQGAVKNARDLLDLPDRLLMEAEMEQEDQARTEDKGDNHA